MYSRGKDYHLIPLFSITQQKLIFHANATICFNFARKFRMHFFLAFVYGIITNKTAKESTSGLELYTKTVKSLGGIPKIKFSSISAWQIPFEVKANDHGHRQNHGREALDRNRFQDAIFRPGALQTTASVAS